jgi:nitrate reductase gamma subunit
MELLEFARGPALTTSLAVFAFGVAWRLTALLLLPWTKDFSKPRPGAPSLAMAALEGVVSKMWPHRAFWDAALFPIVNGYVFHLGLAIVVFAFAPHILFIKAVFGVSWPALPNTVIFAVGVVTAASLIGGVVHRVASPVQRLISRADDYVSWLLTLLPVLTGLAASSAIGARYETLLAIHILSICLFFIWFPFGKLMHAILFIFSRAATGIRFRHRGAGL